MGNFTHEGHDRRRGMNLNILGTGCTVYVCFDCQEQGLTKTDISDWPTFSQADYDRHSSWMDAEWHGMTNKETE